VKFEVFTVVKIKSVETACSSKTLVSNDNTTWHNNPENHEFLFIYLQQLWKTMEVSKRRGDDDAECEGMQRKLTVAYFTVSFN
jgi:hypothetical protein